MADVTVVVRMPVGEYLNLDSGPRRVVEALASEHGAVWVGSGTNMATGMSDIEFSVPVGKSAGLIADLRSVGLDGKKVG